MPQELVLPEQHTHADSGPAWEAAAVSVSLNGQDFHSAPAAAPLHYKYYPHPTLTALEPTGGPAEAEGHVLLVHGSGFAALDAHRDASALACKFGAHDAQPAAWYNDTLVHCAVPTGGASVGPATGLGAGEHLVQISLNGVDWPSARRTEVGRGGQTARTEAGQHAAGGDFAGGSARDEPFAGELRFTVYMRPGVVAVTPALGLEAGGARVVVTGAGFGRFGEPWQARCRFGADEALALRKTDTEIECALPHCSHHTLALTLAPAPALGLTSTLTLTLALTLP